MMKHRPPFGRRGHADRVIPWFLLSATAGALFAAEKPFFLEDFEDGDAGDGSPVTWIPGPTYAAGSTGAVVEGSYVLTTTGDCGVEADESASIGDVSISASARGLSVGSGSYLSFYAHGQRDGSSHWAVVTQMGIHTGYTVGHNNPVVVGTLLSSGFNPFAGDIHIQFDVVGRSLSLTVWRSGLNQPPRPQLTTTVPTTLPAGRVGFGTNYRQVAIHGFDAVRFQPTLRYSSYQRDGARYLRFLQIPTGYTLQSSPSLPAPEWSDIKGSDSIEVPTSGSGLFFQLRGN